VYLNAPAFYLQGKPCWLVVKSIPYSVPTALKPLKEYLKEFKINEKEIEKIGDNDYRIINAGYSAQDMDAMNYSQVLNAVFRKKKVEINQVLYLILSILCACLAEYIILFNYFSAAFKK